VGFFGIKNYKTEKIKMKMCEKDAENERGEETTENKIIE